MHRALVVGEDPVWVQASGFVFHVIVDLVETCTCWELGVIVIFVVRFRVVFCLSVSFFRFLVYMHVLYARCNVVESLHNVFQVATLLLQFFLFVFLEWT